MAKRRTKGSGSIIKRANGYYVFRFTDVNGNSKQKSLRTRNKREAEERAKEFEHTLKAKDKREILQKIAEANDFINIKLLPFDQVWNEYIKSNPTASPSTRENYHRYLNRFVRWINDTFPEIDNFTQITQYVANSYMEHVWNLGVSASTYKYQRNTMSGITRALQNKFNIEHNHWLKTEVKRGVQQKRIPLTNEQVDELVNLIDNESQTLFKYPEQMRTVIKICLFCGCRLIDALSLKWENVDFESKLVSYTPIKTQSTSGVTAIVPLFPILENELLSHKTPSKQSLLICPDVLAHYHRNKDYVMKQLLNAILRVTGDIRNHSSSQCAVNRRLHGIHSLRTTFATEGAKRGVSATILSRMLGDKITTMDKYYINGDLTTKEIAEFNFSQTYKSVPQVVEPERQKLISIVEQMPIDNVRALLDRLENEPVMLEQVVVAGGV